MGSHNHSEHYSNVKKHFSCAAGCIHLPLHILHTRPILTKRSVEGKIQCYLAKRAPLPSEGKEDNNKKEQGSPTNRELPKISVHTNVVYKHLNLKKISYFVFRKVFKYIEHVSQ